MKDRFAIQRFLNSPAFSKTNSVLGVVDPVENEGYVKFLVSGNIMKLDFHSLNIRQFRADAIHQLDRLIEVATETKSSIESLPEPKEEGLPAISSGKKTKLAGDDSNAVHPAD